MRTIVLLHFEYKLYLASAKQLFPLEAKFEERIKNTEQPLNYFTNYSQTFRLIKHLGASQLACDTDWTVRRSNNITAEIYMTSIDPKSMIINQK